MFALDSKYVRYKQRKTVYFIKFYYFSVITQALVTCAPTTKLLGDTWHVTMTQ